MACQSCGGGKSVAPSTLRWTVDLSVVPGKTFADGTTKKVYMTVGEANAAVVAAQVQGRVRPRPATANE